MYLRFSDSKYKIFLFRENLNLYMLVFVLFFCFNGIE